MVNASPVSCPYCRSEQVTASKKGFGVGKAVVGGALLGPVGLAGGFVGSSKVLVTCLNCGRQWPAGRPPRPPSTVNISGRSALIVLFSMLVGLLVPLSVSGSAFYGILGLLIGGLLVGPTICFTLVLVSAQREFRRRSRLGAAAADEPPASTVDTQH